MRRLIPFVLLLLLAAACSEDGGTAPAGGDSADPLAAGSGLHEGACAMCHGPSGGGGVGPALDQLAVRFPECGDQVQWTALGSARWQEEVGDVYGADGTEVGGGMPGFEGSLSESDLRMVSAWTRAQFSGVDPVEAADGCGVGRP